eukprot:m51a1_g1979 hypothetical protein (658) ;mRNA; r:1118690-1121164
MGNIHTHVSHRRYPRKSAAVQTSPDIDVSLAPCPAVAAQSQPPASSSDPLGDCPRCPTAAPPARKLGAELVCGGLGESADISTLEGFLADAPTQVCERVLGQLGIADLCRASRVCRLWYELVRGCDGLWRSALENDARGPRWDSEQRSQAQALLAAWPAHAEGPERGHWRRLCFEFAVPRKCTSSWCGRTFRRLEGKTCTRHPGEWDLWEGPGPEPTGVYWKCCSQRSRSAPGCKQDEHTSCLSDTARFTYIAKCLAYLDSQKRAHPELLAELSEFESLYSRKLWHQLTEALLRAAAGKKFDLVSLYEHFVREFEQRLNHLSLVQFAIAVSAQYSDRSAARKFFEAFESKVRSSRDAHVLALATVGLLRLHDPAAARGEALAGAKAAMESAETELGIAALAPDASSAAGSADSAAACVVAAAALAQYHRLRTEFHRERGDADEFYRAGVAYLGFASLAEMDAAEQRALASSLGVAAAVSRSVYNFGELLGHPIVRELEAAAPDGAWLVAVLRAVNRGDTAALNAALAADAGARLAAYPALRGSEQLLREKVAILALMELVFRRPAQTQAQLLTFAQVAEATGVRPGDVELLVMRALALGLVRGSIDEVAQVVAISWVQPRVLERSQLEAMVGRMDAWAEAIANVQSTLVRFADEVAV